ncbi:hypothetical protein NE237_018613 [Protea cynaroides]|uniref:Uncharacterized protein n=1 Tax=Protea cynaroides TaxID=273540 RepID=A0A9Q0QPC5_9MAGN|nr:hypothetical protein NE237_018613 [Protea cynaroides]
MRPERTTRNFRILSINGSSVTDRILASKALAHLEAYLLKKSGDADAWIADYFDVVAGAGNGGILAAFLFTRGKGGLPMFTADEALRFIIGNHQKISPSLPASSFK